MWRKKKSEERNSEKDVGEARVAIQGTKEMMGRRRLAEREKICRPWRFDQIWSETILSYEYIHT